MKTSKMKSLTLIKEIVVILTNQQASNVRGGDDKPTGGTTRTDNP